MENKEITITITKEDGDLYRLIKNCKDNDIAKAYLKNAAELYVFCNGLDPACLKGYLNPDDFKERVLINKTVEELKEFKEDYEKEIIFLVSDFHPDECECGVMVDSDTGRWFIDEDSRLGFITLYSNYIKMIDEVLNEKN